MKDFRMCDMPGCNAIRGSVSCVERHTRRKIILFEGEKNMSQVDDPIYMRIKTSLKKLYPGDTINIKGKVIDCMLDGDTQEILVEVRGGIEKVEPKKKKKTVYPNDDDMNLRSY